MKCHYTNKVESPDPHIHEVLCQSSPHEDLTGCSGMTFASLVLNAPISAAHRRLYTSLCTATLLLKIPENAARESGQALIQ